MVNEIDESLCHCMKIRRASEAVTEFYNVRILLSGVTLRQFTLLYAIDINSGCSVRVLSDAIHLDRSTLARSLKPLLKMGLVEDRKEAGARDSVLYLTDKGKEVCAKAAILWEEAQHLFEEKLGKEKLLELEEMFSVLRECCDLNE